VRDHAAGGRLQLPAAAAQRGLRAVDPARDVRAEHLQRVQRARVPRRRQQVVEEQVLLLLAHGDQQVDRRPAGLRRRVLRQHVGQLGQKELRARARALQTPHRLPCARRLAHGGLALVKSQMPHSAYAWLTAQMQAPVTHPAPLQGARKPKAHAARPTSRERPGRPGHAPGRTRRP